VAIIGSGKEALVLVKKMKPDVVLLDIGLPDINGLKLAELIRSGIHKFNSGCESYCVFK